MNEKRFELSKSDIKDFRIYDYAKEDAYFIDCDKHTGSCLVSLLNQLSEENEQLKQQLASINQLIDNKIDEFKNGDYGDLPCNTIHMFLDLKQELGDD